MVWSGTGSDKESNSVAGAFSVSIPFNSPPIDSRQDSRMRMHSACPFQAKGCLDWNRQYVVRWDHWQFDSWRIVFANLLSRTALARVTFLEVQTCHHPTQKIAHPRLTCMPVSASTKVGVSLHLRRWTRHVGLTTSPSCWFNPWQISSPKLVQLSLSTHLVAFAFIPKLPSISEFVNTYSNMPLDYLTSLTILNNP